MKTRVLRVIQVFFKSGALKFINVLSKLSRTIFKLKLQIQKGMKKSGNKQENHLQQETQEISREIGESTVDPQSIQLPNSIGVRKAGEFKITKQPPKPPRRVR